MRHVACVLVALGILMPGAGAQQPPRDRPAGAPGVRLTGRVFDARDGTALPRARIEATAGDRHLAPVFADDRGRFTLDLPAAATYVLRLSKAGYATAATSLSAVDILGEKAIGLSRGAAIQGRVLDLSGTPVAGVLVGARLETVAGGPAVNSLTGLAPPVTETDDRGEFRLGGLPAGRYVVRVVTVSAPQVPRLVNEAFETAPDLPGSLVIIDLRPGDERSWDLIAARSPAACRQPRTPPPDPAATSVIRGRITGIGGGPLACATVRLSRPGAPMRTAVTDADGRYTISGLSRGAYTLDASRTGYATFQYGQPRPRESGTVLRLGPGERLDGIDVALPRASAIAGTVVDDHGEPMAGVSVKALELRPLDGRTVATTARATPTDDRGSYRLFGLSPGSYLVSASVDAEISDPDSAQTYGYASVYFPGTTDLRGAVPVEVEIGRDADNTTLTFVRVPTGRISGRAIDPDGQPMRGSVLLMVSHRSGAPALEPRQTPVGPDGSFTFANVPSGDYVLQSIGPAPPASPAAAPGQPVWARPGVFGMQYVTVVDSSPPRVVIRTSRGATVEGRIRFEGPEPAPAGRIPLSALPTDWDRSPALGTGPLVFDVDDQGRFSWAGLSGSRRITLFTAPQQNWYLKSVVIAGQDVTDQSFDFGLEETVYQSAEVVISSAGASVDGRAVNDRGESVGHYAVIVFPIDPTHWFRASRFLEFARADQEGMFHVSGLPPGSYNLAAVDAIEGTSAGGEWQDPEVLADLAARAERITLSEGQRATVALRVTPR